MARWAKVRTRRDAEELGLLPAAIAVMVAQPGRAPLSPEQRSAGARKAASVRWGQSVGLSEQESGQ